MMVCFLFEKTIFHHYFCSLKFENKKLIERLGFVTKQWVLNFGENQFENQFNHSCFSKELTKSQMNAHEIEKKSCVKA